MSYFFFFLSALQLLGGRLLFGTTEVLFFLHLYFLSSFSLYAMKSMTVSSSESKSDNGEGNGDTFEDVRNLGGSSSRSRYYLR